MKDFPKTIYVTSPDPDDTEDFDLGECGYYESQSAAITDEPEGVKVAVYQLVKQGTVKTTRKVVFE